MKKMLAALCCAALITGGAACGSPAVQESSGGTESGSLPQASSSQAEAGEESSGVEEIPPAESQSQPESAPAGASGASSVPAGLASQAPAASSPDIAASQPPAASAPDTAASQPPAASAPAAEAGETAPAAKPQASTPWPELAELPDGVGWESRPTDLPDDPFYWPDEQPPWTEGNVNSLVETIRNAALARGWQEETSLNLENSNWYFPINTNWTDYDVLVDKANLEEWLYSYEFDWDRQPEDMHWRIYVVERTGGPWTYWEIHMLF